jgi:hypothetical protein
VEESEISDVEKSEIREVETSEISVAGMKYVVTHLRFL